MNILKIKDLELNSSGVEFGISLTKKQVNIYYENYEISNYLKYGYIPFKGEPLSEVYNRARYSYHKYLKSSKDENYLKLPENWNKEFVEKYGVKLENRVLIEKSNFKKQFEMLFNAYEGLAFRKNYVGIMRFRKKKFPQKIFDHELLHHVFCENPFFQMKYNQHQNMIKLDKDFIPLPYSSLDEVRTYGELMVESLNKMSGPAYPMPCIPNLKGMSALLGSLIMIPVLSSPLPLIVSGAVLANICMKIPRTLINRKNAINYRRNINQLEDVLGTKNTVKLLQVSGPKEVETLVEVINSF